MLVLVVCIVREHLPLKQGLRLPLVNLSAVLVVQCQRPSSIKIRIKTINSIHITMKNATVRDYLPFKQGLRRKVGMHQCSGKDTVRDHLPLK